MEDYYSCKFYHFCKYGLKLRQLQTVEIDSRLAGSLLHYCLECILKEHFDELLALSEGKIISLAKEIINEYIDANCGGTEDKSNSYKNKLGRFAKRVAKIIVVGVIVFLLFGCLSAVSFKASSNSYIREEQRPTPFSI